MVISTLINLASTKGTLLKWNKEWYSFNQYPTVIAQLRLITAYFRAETELTCWVELRPGCCTEHTSRGWRTSGRWVSRGKLRSPDSIWAGQTPSPGGTIVDCRRGHSWTAKATSWAPSGSSGTCSSRPALVSSSFLELRHQLRRWMILTCSGSFWRRQRQCSAEHSDRCPASSADLHSATKWPGSPSSHWPGHIAPAAVMPLQSKKNRNNYHLDNIFYFRWPTCIVLVAGWRFALVRQGKFAVIIEIHAVVPEVQFLWRLNGADKQRHRPNRAGSDA